MSKKSIKYGHMAQKRRTTGAKASPKRKSTKKSTRKSKTKIPAYKMMVYCALGISICILAYLVADIALKTPSVVDAPSVTERFEEPKKETPKTVAETVKKVEPPKTAPKPAESVKSTKPAQPKPAQQKPAAPKPEPQTAAKTPAPKQASPKPATPAATPVTATKKSSYNFPAAQNGAKIAILLDDGGQNMGHLEKFVSLPFPMTVAVLPRLAYSAEAAARVRSSGKELMLHQPMQSVNASVNPGPGAITPDMSDDQIISTLFYNVNQIGPIAGLNNHEGSAITADAEKMAVVMKFASEEGLYFLDSRTNVETKVPYVAEALGYSYYERNIFLDNEKTRDNVLKELNKGLKIANQNGQAIMIAHVWSADFLPELLKEIYPELESKGYKFVTVSQCSKKY